MSGIPVGLRRLGGILAQAFGGKRDLYNIFGYNKAPRFEHRLSKYIRQDIAGRIIDAPAAALWSNPPQITTNNSEWDEQWNNLVVRHNLFSKIERVDKLAGIGRYAILIVGFNDGRSLDQPVNYEALSKQEEKILYLQPYSELSATIKTVFTNQRSSRYMKPERYTINPKQDLTLNQLTGIGEKPGMSATGLAQFDVHADRVIHIAENTLENDIFGLPRLERVFNVLDDIQKVTGGSAETFWLTANRGMHVDIDKEMELDPTDEQNLTEEIEEYQHSLRRFIRTRGVKIENLGSDTPDPTGTFNMLIAIISGATGIPRRILTGSEAGQLASDQDRANWADRIEERRTNWANPVVLHQLLTCLTNATVLPAEDELEVTVLWPSAYKLSPLEEAQTSAQHARSATNFAKTFDTMHKLNKGVEGQEAQLDEEGNPIPGTEVKAEPGAGLGDLVTIEEARKMIGLDKPQITFDSGADIRRQSRGVKIYGPQKHRLLIRKTS